MKGTFLAKWGRVFGPYEAAEIALMQASGKLKDYHWICESGGKEWRPLDPPPALPGRSVEAAQATGAAGWDTLMHNRVDFVPGALEFVTESGAEFLCRVRDTQPLFALGAQVRLHVADTKKGVADEVTASVLAVELEKDGWRYRIGWGVRPFTETSLVD